MHALERDQRRVNHCGHGQRVIHRSPLVPALLRTGQVEIGKLGDEVVFRLVARLQLGHILTRNQSTFPNVGTDHGDGPAGIENDLCSLRIVVDVRFRRSVDIPASDGASHDDDVFDQRCDCGVFRNCQGYIRQRPDRNKSDFMGILVDHLDDQIGREARIGLAGRGRQIDSGKTILAMPILSRDQLLIQGVLCAARHQHITLPCK